jgi:hypothetical protein
MIPRKMDSIHQTGKYHSVRESNRFKEGRPMKFQTELSALRNSEYNIDELEREELEEVVAMLDFYVHGAFDLAAKGNSSVQSTKTRISKEIQEAQNAQSDLSGILANLELSDPDNIAA